MELWTIKNNKIYDIIYSALPSRYSEAIIKNMIDSFDIISSISGTKIISTQAKSTSQDKTNNFLTYQQYGIKIDYPVGWQKEESVESDNSSGNAQTKITIITFRSPYEDTSLALQPSYLYNGNGCCFLYK
jgi:hypothetical protein